MNLRNITIFLLQYKKNQLDIPIQKCFQVVAVFYSCLQSYHVPILFPDFAKWKEQNTKNTHKGPIKDCYCYCNLFSHGALRSSKNSLKRVRAFLIKMEFGNIGF